MSAVYEGRGFVDGVSEAKLQVQFGEKKVLSKTKATKAVKTTHPVWLDHFELYVRASLGGELFGKPESFCNQSSCPENNLSKF